MLSIYVFGSEGAERLGPAIGGEKIKKIERKRTTEKGF